MLFFSLGAINKYKHKTLWSLSTRTCTHLSERPFHAVPSDDDAVPLVGAPALEQLSAQTALHHTGGRHHHAGADVVEVVHAL